MAKVYISLELNYLGLPAPPIFTGLKGPRVLDMLQISHLLAAFNSYLSIALALIQVVRDTKKGGDVWVLYVEPRLSGDCEEG